MNELLFAALPWLPIPLLGVLLMMRAPLSDAAGRRRIAMVFGAVALVALVVAVIRGGDVARLDVVNAFPKGAEGELKALVFETIEAPGWWAPVWLAVMFGLNALWVVTRWGGACAPSMIRHALDAFGWMLFVRLGLEYAAAPSALVWACGVSMIMVPVAVMQGLYSARVGSTFGRLLLSVFVAALASRLMIASVSLMLTDYGWGTHLDVTPLQGFESAFLDEPVVFGDDKFEKWWKAVFIPQVLMWVPPQFVLGLLGAGISRRWALRKG